MSTRKQASKGVDRLPDGEVSRTSAIMALGGYTSAARLKRIFTSLDGLFPNAHCALVHRSPFELLVATILSAQCTDKRVNQITPVLFERYPTAQDFAVLRPEVLEREVYSTGFFRSKSKNISGASKRIVQEFNGNVPRTMAELLTLPGIGRKSANVVLGSAYGIAGGIVVDTHALRVATRRLRLSQAKEPEGVEQDLLKLVPRKRWIQFSYQFTLFGREVCTARHPRCAECPLEAICDSSEKTV